MKHEVDPEVVARPRGELQGEDKRRDAWWHQRARDLGAAHGFFTVEGSACQGLGKLELEEGRDDEGRELLRNAVAAALLAEGGSNMEEMGAIPVLIEALFTSGAIDAIDQVEPLVRRFRELVKESSQKYDASITIQPQLISLYFCARLPELPCSRTLCWEPLHNCRALHVHSA